MDNAIVKLKKIKLNGTTSKLSNIVIIIGANNSGKTKLLDNLNDELLNSYERTASGDYVRAVTGTPFWLEMIEKDDFEFKPPEVDEWLEIMKIGECLKTSLQVKC